MIRTCVITTSQNTQREIRWVSLLFWHSLKQVFFLGRNECWKPANLYRIDSMIYCKLGEYVFFYGSALISSLVVAVFVAFFINFVRMIVTCIKKFNNFVRVLVALFMRDASIVMMWLKLNFNVIVELWFAPFVTKCNKKNLRVFFNARCNDRSMLSHRTIANAKSKPFSVWWFLLLLLSLHNYILNENASWYFCLKIVSLFEKKKCCDHIDLRQKESTN